MNTLLFIDTETTGRSYNNHDLLEVCATRCHSRTLMPIAKLQFMVHPKGGIIKAAQKINGITANLVRHADPPEIALLDLLNFVRPKETLVGHNFRKFDMKFLDLFITLDNKIIDTLELAIEVGIPKGFRSMGALIEKFGIETGRMHRADADVAANIKIYKELMKMKQPGLF